jgi:hypothetical protein
MRRRDYTCLSGFAYFFAANASSQLRLYLGICLAKYSDGPGRKFVPS